MKRAGLILAFIGCAFVSQAAIPTSENFDGLTVGSDFIPAQNNWGADVANIVVTTDEAQSGANSVNVNSGTISNNVEEATPSGLIWTEFHVIPVFSGVPTGVPSNAVNHLHYFDFDGFINVYTESGFVQVSDDIQGNALSVINTSAFNRISIYQNFNTSTSAVLIDGTVVLQDTAFPGSSSDYDSFSFRNTQSSPSFLDTYSVSTNVPASNDVNNNGTADAQELNDNGYVARCLTVGESGNELFTTLQGAMDVFRTGDKIVVTNVIGTLAGSVTFDQSVTISGVAFTNAGTVTVDASVTATFANVYVDVAALTVNGTLIVSNGEVFQADSLAMGNSGSIQSSGGTFGYDSPFVCLAGTFTISGADFNNVSKESDLNFADTFELYTVGTRMDSIHYFGWGASSDASVIQSSTVQQGSRAATVFGLVSNRVDGASENKVWTDLQVYAVQGDAPSSPDTNNSSVLCYFTTNGYLAVYSNGWVELTTDAAGGAVSALATGTYARVSIFTQYDTDQAAVFLNDQLLIELVSFPSGDLTAYTLFGIDSDVGTAAIDDIEITTVVPADLTGDVDSDNLDDADEIQNFGSILIAGSTLTIFRFQ